jgi:hypothetical protein
MKPSASSFSPKKCHFATEKYSGLVVHYCLNVNVTGLFKLEDAHLICGMAYCNS